MLDVVGGVCERLLEGEHRLVECAQEFGDNILKFGVWVVGDLSFLGNGGQQSCLVGLDVLQEFFLELGDLGGVHFVQITTDTAENDNDLFYNCDKIKKKIS